MLILKIESKSQKWYQKNKQRLSEKRKKLYAENPEYREQRLEASRKYKRGERTLPVPADAPISLAEAAQRIGIGNSTLREWRRKNLFPEAQRHNGALWFTDNQVRLLEKLKEFIRKYKMRPWKLKEARLKEVREFVLANWLSD